MIKIISPLFLISSLSINISYATPADLQKFIPDQWEIISKANGDLNADGQSDVALLIQPENTQIQDHKLLILFKNNQSYTLYLNKKFLHGLIVMKKTVSTMPFLEQVWQ